MKLFSSLAIAALVLVPVSASARQQTQQTSQQQDGKPKRERSAEVGDGTRVICRSSEATGSRVSSTRICMTADEWATQKREARSRVEQDQSRRSTSGQ